MARLEDITDGSLVKGLVNNKSVKIINVRWYGSSVIDVTYRTDDGSTESKLVYREEENTLEVQDNHLHGVFQRMVTMCG